ncbi:taurine dioxygenase [Thermocatellispora tengchongensis]|uniref:Taurine dioxygenase n=1 Tax=Thermocatellispora tengchongensis TaxID=1073253 RepID=A0A840P6B1_9ACTN|nr:TauD/TfdA family dioxygenase [Thermocatellispora tengchongensis]MBB5135208.1 taurine dioxygenase [Thermocatellispora tengchongensis]
MIEFTPVTRNIGAEVTGVDLRKPLSEEEVATIRRGWLEHRVLFFRDQHITDEEHIRFATCFGTENMPAFNRHKTRVHVLDQVSPKGEGGDEWHSDNTFEPVPPMGSLLRCVRLPQVGGDTLWANAVMAFEALSPPIQRLCEELTAVHDITMSMKKAIAKGHDFDLAEVQARWPPLERPVVRVHAETGEKALFVNRASTTRLVGLSDRENEALLPYLIDHIRSPEFQVRLRWAPGTLAFWDNRSTQHYAVADYTERRIMHRVTINAFEQHADRDPDRGRGREVGVP